MNISDYEHESNRKKAQQLGALGFELEVNADGYFVRYQGQGLGGARVLPRAKPLHWRHRAANLRDNLSAAVRLAERSKAYQTLFPQKPQVNTVSNQATA